MPAHRKPPAEVFAAAAASTPQAFDLATRVSLVTRSTRKDIESANLVARLEGSDPALQGEHVVYIAHVDHFGRGVAMNGDDIYNGAHDNASGVAIVLEIAHAFSTLPTPPRRSVLFLFVTAEERGLLGSDYFARNPTVPRERNRRRPHARHALPLPPAAGHRAVRRAALDAVGAGDACGRAPGHRDRHRSHPRAGAVHPQRPLQLRAPGRPVAVHQERVQDRRPGLDGAAINAAYRRDVYHKPNDDMCQPFDFEAGASHARINFLTGWLVAQETARPAWNPGDFFGELFGGAGAEGQPTGAKD